MRNKTSFKTVKGRGKKMDGHQTMRRTCEIQGRKERKERRQAKMCKSMRRTSLQEHREKLFLEQWSRTPSRAEEDHLQENGRNRGQNLPGN